MSQTGPNGARRSMRSIIKTSKLQQLEDEEATQREEAEERALAKQIRSEVTAQAKARRVEERERVDALQANAEAELETAPSTVQMMYDVGDLPGLDQNDPNYDLIRKIAHLTGKNYAGQGLAKEELQEILDDPMADTTPGEGNPQPNAPDNQPQFAAFFPGITFGSSPKTIPKPKSTSGTSKRKHQHSTDSPVEKKRRVSSDLAPPPHTSTTRASPQSASRKGSAVPAEATRRYSPLTRTDNSTFHGGTPTHPHRPPQPPSQVPTPLVRTDSATIIGGTPRQPVKARRPFTSTGLKILGSQSQPSPRPPSVTVSKATKQSAPPRPASSTPRPQHTGMGTGRPSGGDSTPSHPGSPAPRDFESPCVGDSGRPIGPKASLTSRNPPPDKANSPAQEAPRTTTSHTGSPSRPSRSNSELVTEYDQVRTELKAALATYKSLTKGMNPNEPVTPEIVALVAKIQRLRARFKPLIALTRDLPTPPTQPSDTAVKANSHTQNSERERIPSNGSSSRATSAPKGSASRTTTAPTPSPPDTTPRSTTNMRRDRLSAKQPLVNRRVSREEDDDDDGEKGDGEEDGEGGNEGGEGGEGNEGGEGEDDVGDSKSLDDDADGEGGHVRRGGSARSEREKANKPILADFPREDADLLKLAKPHALAALLARGIFKYLATDAGPELEDEEYIYKDAWTLACREAGVNRRYRTIFGKWLKQRRSGYIHHSAKVLKGVADEYLGFSSTNPKRNINISKSRIDRGCHREPKGYAFHSPLLRRGICALVFDGPDPYGITHEELFIRIPSRLIAYTAAIFHYVINGYRKGPWNNDRMNATTQGAFFRQFLKEYEHEENVDEDRQAYGERYRELIFDIGRHAYDTQQPVEEDPMPPAEGTWDLEMELDMSMD